MVPQLRGAAPAVIFSVVNSVSLKHFETDKPAPGLYALPKPVTLKKLTKAFEGLVPGCFGELPPDSTGRRNLGSSVKNVRVLVVDDVGSHPFDFFLCFCTYRFVAGFSFSGVLLFLFC